MRGKVIVKQIHRIERKRENQTTQTYVQNKKYTKRVHDDIANALMQPIIHISKPKLYTHVACATFGDTDLSGALRAAGSERCKQTTIKRTNDLSCKIFAVCMLLLDNTT